MNLQKVVGHDCCCCCRHQSVGRVVRPSRPTALGVELCVALRGRVGVLTEGIAPTASCLHPHRYPSQLYEVFPANFEHLFRAEVFEKRTLARREGRLPRTASNFGVVHSWVPALVFFFAEVARR